MDNYAISSSTTTIEPSSAVAAAGKFRFIEIPQRRYDIDNQSVESLPGVFTVESYYHRRKSTLLVVSDRNFRETRNVDFNWTLFFINLFGMIYKYASVILYLVLAKLLWVEGNVWWFWETLLFVVVPLIFTNALSMYWYWNDKKVCDSVVQNSSPKVSKTTWIIRIISHLIMLGVEYRTIYYMYYGLKVMQLQDRKKNGNHPQSPTNNQQELSSESSTAISNSNNNNYSNYYTRRYSKSPMRKISRHSISPTTNINSINEEEEEFEVLYMCEDRDVSMLQALSGVFQDAPEIILQSYIMISDPEWFVVMNATVTTQLVTTILSLIFIALTLSCYTRATRLSAPSEHVVTNMGLLLLFLWRIGTITARLFAFCLIVAVWPTAFWIEILIHYVIMVAWLFCQNTSFCQESDSKYRDKCGEWTFDFVLGFLYLFCYVNVKDEPTRFKLIFYYSLCFAEDTFNVCVWYFQDNRHFTSMVHKVAMSGVFVCFGVGVLFMVMYYMYYHPHRPLPEPGIPARLC